MPDPIDWALDTDANHFAQSYVKDFIDISGSLVLRENANLTVNGNIETKGNITIKNPIMEADLSLNHNMLVGGDISMNGNVTVGDVSMNGKVLDCSFTDSSIPESAFNGDISPDYTQPTILYEKGFDTTEDVSMNANVQINNLKVDGNIEFSDGTTMNTYDDNVFSSGIRDVAELSSLSVTQIPYDFTSGGDGNMNAQITSDTFGQTVISTDGSVSVIAIGGQSHPWGSAVPLSANGGLLITKNSGISWTKVNMPNPVISGTTYNVSTHVHVALSISRNGQHMMCATTTTGKKGGDQIIHYSHDSGDNWTHANGIPVVHGGRQFGASCISDDGKYMYMNSLEEYKIWYTHDSGSNWTSTGSAGRSIWYNMVCSSDGSKIIGADSNGGGLHISINHGVNWNQVSPAGVKHQIICGNSDLSKVVVSSHHWSNGNSYKLGFFNGGTLTDTNAWSSRDANSLVSDNNYRPKGGVCATSDLKHIIARCEDSTTKCIVSNDYGATWSKIQLNEPCYDNITNMAISDGGTVIYRASNNTNIIKVNLPVVNIFKASTFTSLDISGNLTAGSFSTSSDYRIKTDISKLDETVTLDNLRPVKYLQTLINKPQYGLIAHELQKYYPDLVVGEKDGEEWQRVNYTGLVALLINEIKQLKRELTELENGM